jgi:hypothetical protein
MSDVRDPLKALGDALRDLPDVVNVPLSKTEPKEIAGLPTVAAPVVEEHIGEGFSIRVTEHKVTRHTVDDLLDADLDKLTANYRSHAKKQLFDGNSHHGA